MGLFGLFAPTPKIATSDSLLMLEERHKTTYKRIVDLHDFYMGILEHDPSRNLVISASINNRIIPVIDCDSIPEHNEAREHLRKNNIRHAVFQSSKKPHYWVIPDLTFGAFSLAWRAVCYIPGADHKYLKFVKERNFFSVRGEYKVSNDSPQLTHTSCVEPNVRQFVELLVNHYADERLKIIASLKIKRQLECKTAARSSSWDY